MNKAAFFAAVRRDLFSSGLQPKQVYLIEALLDAFDNAGWPLAHAAYALATAHHETAQWVHLKELGGDAYFKRMYDKAGKRPKVADTLGNTEAGDGVKFAGRGFVQLTGRNNYRKAGSAIGVDLLKEPTRAEEPTIAARILIWGMATGAYTGKANRDYLSKDPPDYVNARRIINGTDKASLIAGYGKTFAAALTAAGYGDPDRRLIERITAPDPAPAVDPEPTRNDGKLETPPGFWSRLATALAMIWRGK
jgi:predicted chitinase